MLGVTILAGVPGVKKVQLGQADEWLYVQYIVQSSIRHVLMIHGLVILFLSCGILV